MCEGKAVVQLTSDGISQAGSVFTTSSVAFDATYKFGIFFQFRMHLEIGNSDGIAFVLQT
jgi:hypothetical protein